MVFDIPPFVTGAILGGAIIAIYSFIRGYFKHFGNKAAKATITQLLPGQNTDFSDEELQRRTLELHSEIAEFQTRKERRRSRNFWEQSPAEMDEEEIMKQQRQQSVAREEMKGEFIKKFAPRLEMVLQEYEKRNIEPDEDMMEIESLRWWAQHGETSRLLPTLRHLAQKLENQEN